MAFCMNCGKQLPDGAKFCLECGTKLGDTNAEQKTQRETTYEGKIFKCPNCGDILDAYESVCESCGYERRGTSATSSVKELSRKLQEIEAQRPPKKFHSIFKQAMNQGQLSKTDEQKIDLIKNFAIPNSKEDIMEFAVLAVSNIDPDAFSTMNNPNMYDSSKKAVSNAWMAKFEQAYQKGQLMFGNTPELLNLHQMYVEKKKAINRKKNGVWKILGITYGGLFAIAGIILIIVFSSTAISENKEIARLESLVEEVQTALAEDDYRLALMNAERLVFSGSNSEHKHDWDIQREYWYDKIIAEAAEDGVTLERPVDQKESEGQGNEATFDLTKENSIGSTQYEFKYDNFLEVKKELEERGFTNVTTQGLKDLGGFFTSQDGMVEKVTVAGETGFPADIAFPLDVEIIIYYHSLKD